MPNRKGIYTKNGSSDMPGTYVKHQAFSLIELSIVLVVLGLLVGGILAGRSLIHAAELRAVTTEYSRNITAAHTFRDKYFALPGDMTNATSVWGSACGASCLCMDSGPFSSTFPQTCNGDGNGIIDHMGSEFRAFWQQLAAAGLVDGSYILSLSNLVQPPTKLGPGFYWSVNTDGTDAISFCCTGSHYHAGDSIWFANNYVNVMAVTNKNDVGTFKPEDAWNVDTKTDDGKPGSGKIVAMKWGQMSVSGSACTTKDGQSPPADANAAYQLTDTNRSCTLLFPGSF
jgi:prepilin-type N-terminal cleavage/methylation domain-containing protein